MDLTYINLHTHHPQSGAVNLSSRMLGEGDPPPLLPYSAGIHPWSLAHLSDTEVAAALDELRADPDLSAVGEIGLDYARGIDRGRQQRIFAEQLRIAAERGLPVVVHCVRAWGDVWRILREHPVRAVIFHGFTGSPQQAKQAADAGYYLSFGHRTFGSPKTVEALRTIPRDRLFLETDDSPTPIETIYRQAAETLGIPVGELQRMIERNYQTVFGVYPSGSGCLPADDPDTSKTISE